MYFFHGAITLFLLAVIYYDFTRYIIPNWISGVLLALYPAMLLMSPDLPADFNAWLSLAVALGFFVFGVITFRYKWMGGGDVKLLTVLALWAGVESGLTLFLLIAVAGGAMSVLLLMLRPLAGRVLRSRDAEKIPKILRHDEPLPYGLAISFGFLFLLWLGRIPGLPVAWAGG